MNVICTPFTWPIKQNTDDQLAQSMTKTSKYSNWISFFVGTISQFTGKLPHHILYDNRLIHSLHMTLLTFFALNFLGSFKTSFHTQIWSDVINCHVYAIKKTKSNGNSPWCFDKVRKGQQIKCKFSSWFISFLCFYRFWFYWYYSTIVS